MGILFSSTALVLAVFAGGALLAWSRGARGLATGLAAVALLPAATIVTALSWPALVTVTGLAAIIVWHRWTRSSATVSRWASRSRRKVGVASSLDIVRHAGTLAVRRRTGTVRPSLAGLPRLQRWRLATTEAAVELCRTGVLRVWALVEDVVIVVGGPRTGKTGWLAGRVLDAPGAALVTSTRTDLLDLCAPLRRQSRGEVFVFNPAGLGDRTSTITFDPLTGCSDPVTATERATDMLAAVASGSGGDREFWDGQARRVLAALLHAAALGDRRMADVLGWVADPDAAGREVPALLRRSGVTAFEQDAMQFITTNERTRSSITSSVMPALGWLTHPAAAAAAEPGQGFDVARLLGERATVFLLGAEEAQTAPLVCALTGHIAREARRLAAGQPAGRLDPPLGLFLDEAALISPVPLESWTADMGGRGVTILCAFQSRAQLLARWGEHKAATILNNTAAVMIFGGTRDKADLEFWSTLAGERDERVSTTDEHGRIASRSVRKVPVLAPAQIANLPAGRVVVIRRGIAPVIGRARMAWKRPDVLRRIRLMARVAAESRRHRRNEAVRVWADAQLERALVVLAARWPARFGELAERVRSSNRMFAELRAIRRGDDVDQVAEAIVLHEQSPSDGSDGPTGDGRWQR
ncbi:type IV secretory system conjugative DNA transfer family protein [Pseudonocardia alni]|uniref:type IV secretory system conjugative DNA transfer family protein n=1 Tax=Pseudonocardia alni TaxID=33907 RepID=UPI001AD63BCE|nr:type IV secretory system conjugative DNA transfer family protein [Pseudonocardia alni]MBO4236837.1 type IV secretory system conjugative DNA transfer family protein [Pseudonocardia alni]